MTKYFQCCKDKKLKTTSDNPEIAEITCCNHRMRELTEDQHAHETAQRAYIDGGQQPGSEPSGTQLMTDLKI
jgi:hypothetical protein